MRDGIEIRNGVHGRGVFATIAFAKGDTVEITPTLDLPEDDVAGQLGDYVFGSAEDESRVILLLGYGMLYNHSADPNVEYVQHGPREIAFVALRDIAAGEELRIDYGEEWWETRGLMPG